MGMVTPWVGFSSHSRSSAAPLRVARSESHHRLEHVLRGVEPALVGRDRRREIRDVALHRGAEHVFLAAVRGVQTAAQETRRLGQLLDRRARIAARPEHTEERFLYFGGIELARANHQPVGYAVIERVVKNQDNRRRSGACLPYRAWSA